MIYWIIECVFPTGQGKYINFPWPLVVAACNHKKFVQALRTGSNLWLHNSLTATTLCQTAVVSDNLWIWLNLVDIFKRFEIFMSRKVQIVVFRL